MKKPVISIIAAIGENRELGKDNKLLWHIPEDLKRFKRLTLGHPVIMGRKTFESIVSSLGSPLPGRTNIIITRNRSYLSSSTSLSPPRCLPRSHPGCISLIPKDLKHFKQKKTQKTQVLVCHSLSSAIKLAKKREKDEIFIIGGGLVYQQAMKYADKMYLTMVKGKFDADTFFPDYSDFNKVLSKKKTNKCTFLELTKN